MRVRVGTGVAGVVCALLMAAVLPLNVAAAPAAVGADQPYLALGDSVPFGFRPNLTPQEYANPANLVGYPELLASQLHLRLTNAACPGETTASFLASTGVDNGCTGYRAFFPLHTTYTGPQIDFAVAFLRANPHTRLVTISLGANDLFLLRDGCKGSIACIQQGLPRLAQTVSHNLTTIEDRLRRDAHYTHALIAVTYYVSNYLDPNEVVAVTALNRAISGTSLVHSARIADGFAAFAAASSSAQLNACAAGLLVRLPVGCDIHPSRAGHSVLANAIRAVLGPLFRLGL